MRRAISSDFRPGPWVHASFAVGRAGFHLSASFVRTRREIGVWLVLQGPLAKPHFHLLAGDRAEIESELGAELEWRELPGKKESHVVLRRSADPTRREDWPEQHAWLRDKLEMFHRVFGTRIKGLDAGKVTPDQTPR